MSTAWPTDIIADECDFYMEKNASFFESPIAKTIQVLNRAGRRWVAEYRFVVPGKANFTDFDGLIDSDITFLMWDMVRPAPINGVIAGVQLVGAHLRGNTSIAVDGLPISQTHLLRGDYVGIGGKLYRLTADVASDTGGEGTLTLNRGLLADAADNAAVNTDRPTCEMLLTNQPSRPIDANWAPTYNLSFIEAIS